MKKTYGWMGVIVLFSALMLLAAMPGVAAPAPKADVKKAKDVEEREVCPAAREYVTALEFLRSHTELAGNENTARQIAEKVAPGCAGAAGRLIRVALVLSRAGITGPVSVDTGLEFVNRTDQEADTFLTVFKRGFLSEYLDLDLPDAVKMARSLSLDFSGDTDAVRKDFQLITDFCISKKGLDLPRPQCGLFAAKMARLGASTKGGIGKQFLNFFNFAQSNSGPHLSTGSALKLAEEVFAFGPGASDNFTTGYKYAVAKSGLGLAEDGAIAFAKKMAATQKLVP